MEVRQYIRPDIAVSAIAHLSILALVMLFTEVHPYARGSEPVAVDLVTPDQVEQGFDPAPTPTPQLPSSDLPSSDMPSSTPMPPGTPASSPAASPAASQPAATAPQRSAARPDRQQVAAAQSRPPQPQPSERQQQPSQPPSQPQPQTPSASLGYVPPEPDVTVKYHVMLGLPEDLPPLSARSGEASGDRSGQSKSGDFDATSSTPAEISSNPIAEFRRHLKTCSKLPASVAPSDNLTVKLRLILTLDGRLATDPMVGGGSPNPKALDLLQSAIQALKDCQPYTMLPADHYREWKVLDLDLTPKDFSS
jgi:hypothetical protein